MARRPTKPPSTSPNKALIILLVLFVLTNIGLAVWVYAAYKEKDKWDTAAKESDKKLKAADQTARWHRFQRDELLAAIGEPKFLEKPEAVNGWKESRKAFLDQTDFKNEDGDVEFLLIMKSLDKNLGFDGKDGRYKMRFAEIRAPLEDEVSKLQKQLAKATADSNQKQQALNQLEKQYKDARDLIVKDFQKGNNAALEELKKTSDTMSKLIATNDDLRKQMGDKEADNVKAVGERDNTISNLKSKLKLLEDIGKSTNRFASTEPHALMLDISTGKPLWDTARAKIVRVEDGGKKIFINKGSKDSVKPGLTFTVFAAGSNGQAVGEMKATVEVIRVEDANTALCKIATFYDADGRETAANEATPARLFREGGGALKEGDLLFNLCWGTHVAVVGIADLTGVEAKNPAVQMDHLKEFMRHLERMGIVIDAYIDLRDGKLIGEITNKTNYVIRGQSATKTKEGDDDARLKAINGTILAVRDQALDRGLYIISAENFAVVTGYRRPGSADATQTFTFTPARPASAPPTTEEKK